MPDGADYSGRINQYYSFIEEFLDLFKGQITVYDLKHNLTYKEAIFLRNSRIDRLNKEAEEAKKKGQPPPMAAEAIREMILAK